VKFEKNYIDVRQKEERVLSDEEVARLPRIKSRVHIDEWHRREHSANRIERYFNKTKYTIVLDLGCGNGWFTSMLAENETNFIVGLDVNNSELIQAARVFQKPNLFFVYGDIFNLEFPSQIFDFITVNAAIQYFPDVESLLARLFSILKENGEIHIIDSPFYKKKDLEDAKRRSENYYTKVGNEQMIRYYHHQSMEDLKKYNHTVLYDPTRKKLIRKLKGKKDMPFPWIRIKK